MNNQDYDLEVINDCNYMNERYFGGLEVEQIESHHFIDHVYRSAPNIHGLNSNYMFTDEANDFVMNSFESVNDEGCYFSGAQEDISFQQDEDDRPFQSEDIFDRMHNLEFDNVNGSLLEDENENQILQNDQNFSLDSAFNFDLNINTKKNKPLIACSFTDRVSCSLMQRNSPSRSQERKKSGSFLKNQQFINTDFKNLMQISMFKNKNTSHKKKFQPFTEFIKQSKILGQILPSNNLNDTKISQKSLTFSLKNEEKSTSFDKDTQKNQDKEKLLKKIDKLLFANSNKKSHQMLSKKNSQNEQRNELRNKRFDMKNGDKQNCKKIETVMGKKIENQNAQFTKSGTKVFKRTKKLKQQNDVKDCKMTKKRQNFEIEEVTKLKINKQKLSTNNNFFKKNQIQPDKQNKIISCKQQQKSKQKDSKLIKQLSSDIMTQLKQILTKDAFQLVNQLNKLYKQSTQIISQSQIYDQNSKNNVFLLDKLQKDIDIKIETLNNEQNQVSENIKALQLQHLQLKNALSSINYQPKQQKQSPNQCNYIFGVGKIKKKRQQMRKQFNLWKQLSF